MENNSLNNSLGNLFERKMISDKFELDRIKKRIEEIEDARSSLSTKFEKIEYDMATLDEYNELRSLVRNGIVIEDISFKEEIIDNLYSFFGQYGLSRDKIVDIFSDIEFFVSDINLGYEGKLVYVCGRIGIDASYVDFSEEGKFIGLKEEFKDFFMHTFTHEFLHRMSSKEEGRDVIVMEDALIEGYTDMFAHLVSGRRDVVSDLYGFPEKVCVLFTEMMGMEKTVDDYLHHNQTHSNLHNLFLECGCQDFSLFRSKLSKVISGVKRDKQNGMMSGFALEEKDDCLAFLRDNILIPYCIKNADKAPQVLDKFNSLFGVYDYNCSLNDVKNNNRK